MCECCICKRKFEYGDKWSPMLKEEVWKEILNYYDILKEEKEKEIAFYNLYDIYYLTRSNNIREIIEEIWNLSIFHTFICYECMEKALGRKLKRTDLIDKNVPFNIEFEKEYFKQ